MITGWPSGRGLLGSLGHGGRGVGGLVSWCSDAGISALAIGLVCRQRSHRYKMGDCGHRRLTVAPVSRRICVTRVRAVSLPM